MKRILLRRAQGVCEHGRREARLHAQPMLEHNLTSAGYVAPGASLCKRHPMLQGRGAVLVC